MKKIKSVKLAKDFRTALYEYKAGTGLSTIYCEHWNTKDNNLSFHESIITSNTTGLFDIAYENDFFEVKLLGDILLSDSGNVYNCYDYSTANYNRFATRQDAEFENMRRETLHYFRELAKELNGGTGDWGWKYSLQSSYKCLRYREGQLSLEGLWSTIYECIKFSPSLTIEQITERALPSMIENFIKLCKAGY